MGEAGASVNELKRFLALVVAMGIIKYPSIESHWGTMWPYATSSVSMQIKHINTSNLDKHNVQVMKRDCFTLLLRFLHLNNNSQYIRKGQPSHDPLYKLHPFMTHLIQNFQSSFTLHREVSVDESMIDFKGRLSFIQYMPKKPTKWEMKAFVLSDAQRTIGICKLVHAVPYVCVYYKHAVLYVCVCYEHAVPYVRACSTERTCMQYYTYMYAYVYKRTCMQYRTYVYVSTCSTVRSTHTRACSSIRMHT